MNTKTANLLDIKASKTRVVWMLAWPAIIEQVLLSLVNYIDTAMVGALGPDATAAVGINSAPAMLVMSIMSIIATGFSILVAQNIGARKIEEARENVRQSIFSIVLVSSAMLLICFPLTAHIPLWMGIEPRLAPDAVAYLRIMMFALPFQFCSFVFSSILRGAGDTRSPMILNACSNLINVVLNYLFIYPTREITFFGNKFTMFGAGWGVAGAAWGSAISMAITGTALAIMMFRKNYELKLSIKDKFKFSGAQFKEAMGIGVPAGFERITVTLGQIASTRIIATLGTTAIAAHTLANTAESMCYLPAAGFGNAATTLVAQSHGASRDDDAYGFGMKATMLGIYSMVVFGIALFVFAPTIMSLFTPDQEVIRIGSTLLRIVAFAQPMSATGGTLSGALRGVNDVKFPFFVGILGMWGIRIPLATVAILFMGYGVEALWLVMTIDLIVRGALSFIRFRKKKWWRAQVTPTTEENLAEVSS